VACCVFFSAAAVTVPITSPCAGAVWGAGDSVGDSTAVLVAVSMKKSVVSYES